MGLFLDSDKEIFTHKVVSGGSAEILTQVNKFLYDTRSKVVAIFMTEVQATALFFSDFVPWWQISDI